MEERFLGDRLGIFAQVTAERKNLTSNELSASYYSAAFNYGEKNQLLLESVGLSDIVRDRQRYGATVVFRLQTPERRN